MQTYPHDCSDRGGVVMKVDDMTMFALSEAVRRLFKAVQIRTTIDFA